MSGKDDPPLKKCEYEMMNSSSSEHRVVQCVQKGCSERKKGSRAKLYCICPNKRLGFFVSYDDYVQCKVMWSVIGEEILCF